MSPAAAGLLDWPMLMTLGLGALRLSARDFWTMTPRELERALTGALGQQGQAPLDRRGLAALMRRFPDRPPSAAKD